jgi:XTP/dITP diphosphohydrolase
VIPWVIATRSTGKLLELVPLFRARGIEVIGLDVAGIPESPDEASIEVFTTFEDNARAKAVYFARLTGRPCIADDSGLCIEALDGGPGVRSRRIACDLGYTIDVRGEDAANNEAVLDACWNSGWAPPWRAYYACAAAYADATETAHVASGRTDGAVQSDHSGDGGFGYDPYFVSDDLGLSFGLASREEKSRVSHRARAFTALVDALQHTLVGLQHTRR